MHEQAGQTVERRLFWVGSFPGACHQDTGERGRSQPFSDTNVAAEGGKMVGFRNKQARTSTMCLLLAF